MEERYVTWDRWDAEHHALRSAEDAEHRRLDDRIDEVAGQLSALGQAATRRADRRWNVLMVVLGSLILPLLIMAVVALMTAAHPVP